MYDAPACLLVVVVLVVAVYIVSYAMAAPAQPRPRPRPRPRRWDEDDDYYGTPEFYDGGADGAAAPSDGAAAQEQSAALQSALDFSDVMVTDKQRAEAEQAVADSQQIQTVNERYAAAKRTVTENRLRQGVFDDEKQRRQLVNTLLRRAPCGRRVRSWRTENSDILRGDVIPKTTSSWGMLRAGHSNPEIDLHPGALGPTAGRNGQWLQAEPIADNEFDDLPDNNS